MSITYELAEGMEITFPKRFGYYLFDSPISKCHGGVIIKAQHIKTLQFYACKVLLREQFNEWEMLRALEHETRLQFMLSHQNLVKNHETIYIKDVVILVLDFCVYGDLLSYIQASGTPNDRKKIMILRDILKGLNCLHKHDIAHRDIKLENVFIDSNFNSLLGDFGCCECVKENKNKEFIQCGTSCYMAPEVILGKIKDPIKSDIWSFGILVFTLWANLFPWHHSSEEGMLKEILSGVITYPNTIPLKVQNLVRACCNIEPSKRPTVDELLALPIFSDGNKAAVKISKAIPRFYSLDYQSKIIKPIVLNHKVFSISGSNNMLPKSLSNKFM